MDNDNDNAESVVNEDRLSTLPDELIHQILSFLDTKFAVQTCVLSPRWKFLWTTMPFLNFDSSQCSSLPKFAEFVKHILTRRDYQTELTSLKLKFEGAANQVFLTEFTNYAFAHNVQQLTVKCCSENNHEFPPCLFSSSTLKRFTFSSSKHKPCLTPVTPWDFPALTTLHLSQITLCDDKTREPVDIFSKCVNLKKLVIEDFNVSAREVFDIVAPQLSTLTLLNGRCSKVMNLITPQLEDLSITKCSIQILNAPPGVKSFHFVNPYSPVFFKNRLHSLDKVSLCLGYCCSDMSYEKENVHEFINFLQEFHSARSLTLNFDIIECLATFPDIVSRHPSPFSNLVCLNIYSFLSPCKTEYTHLKLSKVRNFFLENSPTATISIEYGS